MHDVCNELLCYYKLKFVAALETLGNMLFSRIVIASAASTTTGSLCLTLLICFSYSTYSWLGQSQGFENCCSWYSYKPDSLAVAQPAVSKFWWNSRFRRIGKSSDNETSYPTFCIYSIICRFRSYFYMIWLAVQVQMLIQLCMFYAGFCCTVSVDKKCRWCVQKCTYLAFSRVLCYIYVT